MPSGEARSAKDAAAGSGQGEAMTEDMGVFVPLERHERTCSILIHGQEGVEWNYFGNWSLARFDDGAYRPLWLWEQDKLAGPYSSFLSDTIFSCTSSHAATGFLRISSDRSLRMPGTDAPPS